MARTADHCCQCDACQQLRREMYADFIESADRMLRLASVKPGRGDTAVVSRSRLKRLIMEELAYLTGIEENPIPYLEPLTRVLQ
jgi:hypothetical protein